MDRDYKETILAIIATIIISIIVSSLVEFSVVSPYLYATNRAVSIFDFYNHIESNNIYLIGSSQIESGVDARIIGKDVYNLGLSGDTPLRRLIELNRLIETKPRSVIIGLSYFGLDDNYSGVGPSTADQIAPVADKINLDSVSKDLFTEEELKLIQANAFYYNRKFIGSGLFSLIYHNPSMWNATNFTTPLNWPKSDRAYKLRIEDLNEWQKIVNEKDYRQKSALNHTISELRKNNIKVIVLNMPLNPILSANMSKETRDNYFNYFKSLNSTGTEFYDFEACCSGEYFHDLVHLNDAGRKHFTELLCPIVK